MNYDDDDNTDEDRLGWPLAILLIFLSMPLWGPFAALFMSAIIVSLR